MGKSSARFALSALAVTVLLLSFAVPATAQSGPAITLQRGPGGWTHPFGGAFPAVPGSALPVQQDSGHIFVAAGTSNRFGDLANPNLKPSVKESMKKDSDEVDAGKLQFTGGSSCLPAGVPMFMLAPGPFFFLQTPTKVVIVEEQSQNARRVYLDVPHSANLKPSWFGESVGRYEGDTLVIDTIGIDSRTIVDSFRTPHTDKLHVTERWHIIDGGNMLEVNVTVDDPDTFHHAWQTYQRYQRGQRPLIEDICPENNTNLFDYHMPVADRPDF